VITAFPTQQELLSLFDYRDGVLYWKKRKQKRDITQPAGNLCATHGYVFIRLNRVLYRSHRLIWCMFYGYEPSEIDHINRNRSDNRIENLREVSRSQNNYNHPVRADNKSGHRNVSWHTKTKKWRVVITANKKTHFIGQFKDFELASLVAEEARAKYHRIST
jgi:hypothetical protein